MPKFSQFKTIFELYLMGYYFCVKKKISKKGSLEHFGSSEHKILLRNKSFIEIISYYWKHSRTRWKINLPNQSWNLINLLMFWWLKSLKYASQKKFNGKKWKKKNLKWLDNFENIFLILNREPTSTKSIKYKQFGCKFEDKMDNKLNYNQL